MSYFINQDDRHAHICYKKKKKKKKKKKYIYIYIYIYIVFFSWTKKALKLGLSI